MAFLAEGFEFDFKLNYKVPFYSGKVKNLKSVLQNEVLAKEKLDQEVALGRLAGPFPFKPISNLRCSLMIWLCTPPNHAGTRILKLSYNVYVTCFFVKR